MIRKYFIKYNFDRTQKANINTILSLFFKGGSVILSMFLIPLTINYIKPDAYGLWITLTSFVGWFAMFDIGIANGLKNKLSESLAKQNFVKGRMFVSSTYAIISIIALLMVSIYFILYKFIDWQIVFNSNIIAENELRNVVTIVAILFFLKFVSDIIFVVSAAFQMVFLSSFLSFLSNLGITLSVWILSKTIKADLILLAFVLTFIPLLISVITNIYLYNTYYKKVKPSFKKVNFSESKSLLSLGSQFFILQIIGLIIFQTDNILIAQFFNLTEVTNFNVAYKYYSIIVIFFTLILTPYWTAFTEAFFKKDFNWLKKSINRLVVYWIFSLVVLILMFFASDFVIKLWLGNTVAIPVSLSLSICLYIAVTNWNAIFANFLNGVGKIRVQIIYAVFMGIINIPLCFVFVKYFKMGTFSIPLSNSICLLFGSIISFIQYKKIINGKANGVWNK